MPNDLLEIETGRLSDEALFEEYLRVSRERFKTDLFWAAKNGLGYDELDDELHGDFCNRLQRIAFRALKWPEMSKAERKEMLSDYRFMLSLLPRGHAKTTCLIALVCVLIANDSEIRILIKSQRLGNVTKILSEAKSHFMGTANNSHFREWFPEFCPKNPENDFGTMYEMTVPNRKNHAVKEPTVLISSSEQSVVSKHFSIKLDDDLVNEENTQTPEQMERAEDVFIKDQALLDPGAPELVTGTCWDYSDMHASIRNNEGKRYSEFDCYIREISEAKCRKCGTWFKVMDAQECPKCKSTSWKERPIWPFRYTMKSYMKDGVPDSSLFEFNAKGMLKESIPDLRNRLGEYIFNCLYRNRPQDSETASLKWDAVRIVEENDYADMEFYPFMTMDTAGEDKGKKGSFFVISIVYALPPDVMLVREVIRFRGTGMEFINKAYDAFERYSPVQVGMENTSYGMVYEYDIKNEGQRRGLHMNVEPIIRQGGPSKTMRIRRLAPRVERGRLWVLKDCPGFDAFRDEMVHFPKYKYRDILDTITDAEQMIFAPELVSAMTGEEPLEDKKRRDKSMVQQALADRLEGFGTEEGVQMVNEWLGSEA